MNFKLFLLEILLAFVLFFIMLFLKKKKEETIIILIPNIYMIIVASCFNFLKNYTFLIIVFYLLIDILNIFLISKKETLVNDEIYFKDIFLIFIISLIIHNFYLLKVENPFININEFKNFIWALIIIYLYNILKKDQIKDRKMASDSYDKRYEEYVVLNYARFKNKYGYLIKNKNKNKNVLNVLYSFMIFENYYHSDYKRLLVKLTNKFTNSNVSGLMQVESNHFLTDEESIIIVKDKLVLKYNKIKKLADDKIVDLLIKEKYQNLEDIKKIKKILSIIEKFNKD